MTFRIKVVKISKDKQEHKPEEQVQEQTKVEPKVDKIHELTDTLQRLQAEFENYKKRSDKEAQANAKNANARLIGKLLPVLDSFDQALKIEHTDAKYKKGMELIHSQLISTLESQGLKVINTKDQKFDPFKHEVLMVKETEDEDDKIIQELQKGYMLNDIILRHSKVMIAKNVGGKQNE